MKFKAWDVVNKCWKHDFLLAPTGHVEISYEPSTDVRSLINIQHSGIGWGDYTIIDWTDFRGIQDYKICLSTETLDINDVELFEGDIIKFYSDQLNGWKEFTICFDIFNGFNFGINAWNFHDCLPVELRKTEKIGNIYERD